MISHFLSLISLRSLLMLLPFLMVACGGGTPNTAALLAEPMAQAAPITQAQLGQMIFTDNNLSVI